MGIPICQPILRPSMGNIDVAIGRCCNRDVDVAIGTCSIDVVVRVVLTARGMRLAPGGNWVEEELGEKSEGGREEKKKNLHDNLEDLI